ncbi:MAG TPA: ParB/RepB/Spo0J family partition protein [Candidatus Dormibacteraeota bacterium]|nr:ParB/RepB/Spo0J family partition protein [Candidatus Dormibacteraeota bacterium]
MSRSALGKGLNALIRPVEPPQNEIPTPATVKESPSAEVDVDRIDPNPYQPRRQFREEALEELAQSIRSTGIIQPLILRKNGPRYQLIAGERRWRAAKRAGLTRVPAIVRDIPETEALEITLVENIQREDLSPVEEAKAFDRLTGDFGLTQEDVARRTGKDRATIANTLRLLKLENTILEMIDTGRLSAGHGRALLAIEDGRSRVSLAERAARGRLTVRQIERLATRRRNRSVAAPTPPDPNVRAAIEELQRTLGTRIVLRERRGSRPGLLGIEYYDEQQLISLYDRLLGR